jgi:FKBP-type peptidyl-prolyl cis-trans isomerase 2
MMKKHLIKLISSMFALGGLSLIAAACAAISPVGDTAQIPAVIQTRIVQEGDVADINYICRLKNGEIIAASGSIPASEKKSDIFAETKMPGALTLQALKPDEPIPGRKRPTGLENEIKERLARKVTGMQEGETGAVELTAEMIPAPDEKSGFAHLTKTRTREKERKMTRQEFKAMSNKDAAVGQTLAIEPGFSGRVESVTDQDVIICVIPAPGGEFKTPFGMARIREEAQSYKVDIDAKEGTLVRLGPFIGRIVGVTDKVITIDNRHPFGYEALTCDVTITGLYKAGEPETEAKKAECKTCKKKE